MSDNELPVVALVVLATVLGRVGVGRLLGEGGLACGAGHVTLGVEVARKVGVGRAVDAHGDLDAAARRDAGDGAVGEGVLGLGADINVTPGDGPAALVHHVGGDLGRPDDVEVIGIGQVDYNLQALSVMTLEILK